MRDLTPSRWKQWRVTLVEKSDSNDGFIRRPLATVREQPGPDGIRHGLVARIRQEIAEGAYDTDERWLAAEAILLSRLAANP